MIPQNAFNTASIFGAAGHSPEQEWQAAKILDALIEQTAQQEYDEKAVEGLIKKYEQLMS